MHNMSNLFFKFISNLIYEYFSQSKPSPGERYYLILNNNEDVEEFTTSLDESLNPASFSYRLENGEDFITRQFCYDQGADLVVANTSKNITNDFLVTLRNRVGDQVDEWNGKALLSIISDDLDSISGGSISLQSEGMPLHPKELSLSIRKKIQEEVQSSTDRIILNNYLSQIDHDRLMQFTTFYDYKEVIEILHKGHLSNDDFKNLGMFKDEQLDTYKGSNLEERLQKNKELYSKLEKLNELNQDDSEYEKLFLDKDISALKKDDWRELDFKLVFQSNKKRSESNKRTKVEFDKVKIPSNVRCEYFIRPLGDKGAAKRKFQMLVYTDEPEMLSFSININVSNSEKDSLQQEFLKHYGSGEVKVRKRTIDVTLDKSDLEASFQRLVYKHDNKASLGAEFNICILPFREKIFSEYHTSFEINYKDRLIKLPFDSNEITLGVEPKVSQRISEEQDILEVEDPEGAAYEVPEEVIDREERVLYTVLYKNVKTLLELAGEKPETTPIKANRLAKLKRETQASFTLKGSKITSTQAHEYYIYSEYKKYIDIEYEWLSELSYSGSYNAGQFFRNDDIKLPLELKDAYNRFVNSFLKKAPSLTHWDEKIQTRAIEYVKAYINAVTEFGTDHPGGNKCRNIFKLGLIYNSTGDEIWVTPFHPLNVAFELRKLNKLFDEDIEIGILDRLKPDGLLPFVRDDEDQVYNPDSQQSIPGWMVYKKVDTANVVDADLYLDKVVKDKLNQFEEHFSYLFLNHSSAPIKVNVINILNDYQVIRGLIKWYLEKKNKLSVIKMPKIVVNVYRESKDDSFCEQFTEMASVADFEQTFDLKLKTKDQNESSEDLLSELHRNIEFFVTSPTGTFDYAHISFYKMEAQKQFASQPMANLESGVSMDGLYNTIPSKKFEEDYRSGFGIKDYSIEKDDLLLQTAFYSNELAANIVNHASNTYMKGEGIVARTTLDDLNVINNVLDSSNWVTFVDPGVELDFFESTIENLLVIHYNDQYSSSSRYDAVTVTSRSNQYYEVIKEFFDSLLLSTDQNPKTVERTISAFNTINGEWLLKILGTRGYYTEEKLSIIAAIKASLAYFNHNKITWVPISLEEVLRVAGAVNLSRSTGIFTAKNLGVTGKHSDDVLLIGLEENEGLKVHLYPIEVKIGNNESNVINKAKEQVAKTSNLLEAQTIEKDQPFMKEFYRNFFVQLFTSNAKRICQTGFFKSKDYHLSNTTMEALKKGNYEFVDYLNRYIGKGAIFSYKKSVYMRSNELVDDVLLIEMPKEDDLKPCIINEVSELETWLTNENSDFNPETILKYCYQPEGVENPQTTSTKEKIMKLLND